MKTAYATSAPTTRRASRWAMSGPDEPGQSTHQPTRDRCLQPRHLGAQAQQLVAGHQLAGAGEHLGLFLLRVMLHQVLEDLGLGRELLGLHAGALDLGQDHVHHVMLLERLEVELPVVLLPRRLPERGIEDLFLDARVDGELLLDGRQELLALADRLLGRLIQLAAQRANLLVVVLEQRDRVLLGGAALLGCRHSSLSSPSSLGTSYRASQARSRPRREAGSSEAERRDGPRPDRRMMGLR